MRRPLFLAIALAVAVAGFGCHPAGDPILGTWNRHDEIKGIPVDVAVEFKGDGSFTMTTVAQKSGARSQVTLVDTGTWRQLSPNHYTKLVKDIDVNVTGASAAAKLKMDAGFMSRKPKMIADANKQPDFTTKSIGTDQLALTTSDQKTQTYKRIN